MDKMKNEPAFINRKSELQDLRDWIAERPGNLLFIYGPKSSGKTTLLMEFVRSNLDDANYDIKHFNLRELLITSYKDFIRSFFRIDYDKSKGDVKEVRSYSLPFFRLSVEVLKGMESTDLDALAVMKIELQKSAAQGRRPVIIIDELQALEGIYMNGQRELLKELFNFFVAISKESHLCHVIIASSDGYFIERIYNDSKLKKTSKFLSVDYLNEDDIYFWLRDLPQHSNIVEFSLSDELIALIWDTLGGSVWEVSALLGDLLRLCSSGKAIDRANLQELLAKKVDICRAMYAYYAHLDPVRIGLCVHLGALLRAGKHEFNISDFNPLLQRQLLNIEQLRDLLADLVRQNFLALDPTSARYSLQGRSMELGVLRYCDIFADEFMASINQG